MTSLPALLWKDWRLSRAYLLTAAAALIGPYIALAYIRVRLAPGGGPPWDYYLLHTALVAGLAMVIVTALLAGATFATERTDRSVEFLAYLPVAPASRLLSKLLIVGLTAGLLSSANPLLLLDVLPHGWPEADSPESGLLLTLICTEVLVLGAAWLGSTLASSAAALLIGLLAPFLICCGFFLGVEIIEGLGAEQIDKDLWFPPVYRWLAIFIGVAAWLLGSLLFMKRDNS